MLKRLVLDHWFLKLLSLAFAVMLWMYVAGDEATSEVSLEALLEFRNVPRDAEIVNREARRVMVSLRGPAATIRDLSSRTLLAGIDCSRLTFGQNVVGIDREGIILPAGVEILDVIPPTVKIELGTDDSTKKRGR